MDENASLILTALAQGAAQAALDVVLEAHALDPASHAEALRHQLQAASLVDDPPPLLDRGRHPLSMESDPTADPSQIGREARGVIGQTVIGASVIYGPIYGSVTILQGQREVAAAVEALGQGQAPRRDSTHAPAADPGQADGLQQGDGLPLDIRPQRDVSPGPAEGLAATYAYCVKA